VTPSGSPYPLPTPADPSASVVTVVFLAALVSLSAVLWWRVRRAWRDRRDAASDGPWPSEDGGPGAPR
jgi:hypothetical protein